MTGNRIGHVLMRDGAHAKMWLMVSAALSLSLIGVKFDAFSETDNAKVISGSASLSGSVTAPKPFKAAQVYARNTDKNIVYMVYTSAGKYRAVDLFPGKYEVSVKKRGLSGDLQQIELKSGQVATVNFSLREVPIEPLRAGADRVTTLHGDQGVSSAIEIGAEPVSYDVLYPAGPGRAIIERTCMVCHGVDFVPRHHWSRSQWNAAVMMMTSNGSNALIPSDRLNAADREDLLSYLTEHFGPGSPKRELDIGQEMPVNEEALSKAMYVEFYLPLDPKLDADKTARIPTEPHFDRDGNVWYTDFGEPSRIGRLDPRTGVIEEFQTPSPKAQAHGITIDKEGIVWWTGGAGLGRLDPQTGKMTVYSEPKEITGAHTPALDASGNVWFTDIIWNKLGKWDRETDKVTLFEVPTSNSRPYGIAVDKNSDIWFAEYTRCKIVKFHPDTSKFTEYTPPTFPCHLQRLGVDSRNTVWFGPSNGSVGKLANLDPKTGKIVEYTVPMPYSSPYDIWPDREDNIWISDQGQGGTLIRFDQRTKKFIYYPTPQKTDMPKIEITHDGAVWYCARSADHSAVGVLYPNVDNIKTMGAYY